MPLETEIIGVKGEIIQLTWDFVALSIMLTVGLREGDPDFKVKLLRNEEETRIGDLPMDEWIDFSWQPIYYLNTKAPLWKVGEHKVQNNYEFKINDERTIILRKGYKLRMRRVSK